MGAYEYYPTNQLSQFQKQTNYKPSFHKQSNYKKDYLSNEVSRFPTMRPSSYHEPIVEEPMNDVNSKFIVPNYQKIYQVKQSNFQTEVSKLDING